MSTVEELQTQVNQRREYLIRKKREHSEALAVLVEKRKARTDTEAEIRAFEDKALSGETGGNFGNNQHILSLIGVLNNLSIDCLQAVQAAVDAQNEVKQSEEWLTKEEAALAAAQAT